MSPGENHIPDRIRKALKEAGFVVVTTGAGVSAESGVPTFRGEEGLWHKHRAEELATPEAFARDPGLVWEWYDWRRALISKCEPNPAHRAIAGMEGMFDRFLLVTQNIDGLHRRAGSKKIVELHGNIWRVRCTGVCPIAENHQIPLADVPARCGNCGKLVRPDVVWFGEGLNHGDLEKAFGAAETCDVMIVVGTSAVVQPAASLPVAAKQAGAVVMEVNIEPTPLSPIMDHSIFAPAGEGLPELLEAVKGRIS